MKLKITVVYCLLFTVYCLLFFSCRKEKKNPSWDVDVLAPLVKSTLTINNIIPNSLLNHNPDNSLDIVYNTSLYSFSTISIPDTTIDTIYTSNPFTLSLPAGTFFVNPVDQEQKFPIPNKAQLTKVDVRSGKLVVVVRNRVEEMIRVRYQIPSAKINNLSFDKTFDVPAQTGGGCPGIPTVFTATYDMSGYSLDFRGTSGSDYNTLVTNVSAQINPAALSNVTVTPCDSIYIGNSFVDMVPQYAKGYFGHTVKDTAGSSTFSLFKHIIDGTLNLEDIDIGFSIENSIGADATFAINNLSSINTRTGDSISLQHPIIGSPVNINRAVDNNGNVTSSLYQFSIKPSSPSNILPFIQNLPDRMSYQMNFEINPLGNVSGSNDFIYYNKLIKTNFNMTIPLSLVANNLTMADTMDFKMDASADNFNHGILYLYAENGFPFTAEAQLYLMNDNLMIVDSLINTPNMILAPQLDANYICAGQRLTKLAVSISEDKMNLLRSTKKMYLKIKFNTAGQPNYVKIYDFYQMNVKLVGDFNYTVGK
ncbi:MAG: hypothetical protein HY841_04500 [Bacteroidetes bacterium]|nr:hypothetical protein [Bacteroidota bacterium]